MAAMAGCHDAAVPPPHRRRAIVVALVAVMLIALSVANSWQLAILGIGFVAIGLTVIIRSRRRRSV